MELDIVNLSSTLKRIGEIHETRSMKVFMKGNEWSRFWPFNFFWMTGFHVSYHFCTLNFDCPIFVMPLEIPLYFRNRDRAFVRKWNCYLVHATKRCKISPKILLVFWLPSIFINWWFNQNNYCSSSLWPFSFLDNANRAVLLQNRLYH